ncbi:MAG: hypothetical protein H6739_13090 [Alphaproteobacteria bacterium]|nr:hypothetical protein [Alphaproteobacteria bacterium]
MPDHLRNFRRLYVREGERVLVAPEADQAVARGYPIWEPKGAWRDGRRITILTEKARYAVGEEVRVIHVAESVRKGDTLWVAGPKEVRGEIVDGVLVTPPYPEGNNFPFSLLCIYDGLVVDAPGVDYGFEITSRRFGEPGVHTIVWRAGVLESNTIMVIVGG